MIRYAKFRRRAEAFWSTIPPGFRRGALLLVHEEAHPDPEHPDVVLLGMCEAAFAALGDFFEGISPHDQPSLVHIWYGSFVWMYESAPAFDWVDELEETILHELTHHWEYRAGLEALDRFDDAQILNFRRLRGEAVPPYFWRDGEAAGPDRWVIDADLFVEIDGPPPWTVETDAGETVTCGPSDDQPWAVVPRGGVLFDGRRGDLVVASRPPERVGLLKRIARWWGATNEARGKP